MVCNKMISLGYMGSLQMVQLALEALPACLRLSRSYIHQPMCRPKSSAVALSSKTRPENPQVLLAHDIFLLLVQMVQLALELLVDKQGQLDPAYINPNLAAVQHTSVLQQHLSSSSNASLTDDLSSWAATAGEPTQRLLRIMSRLVKLESKLCSLLLI